MKNNRLIFETSPYLRSHAHNPVDWYPWCDEALAKAKNENKPILLSIGYSACHWCHVMERESFENQATAKLMNDHFVSIKVDREERPDLDQIYQNVAQLMTRSGGWPLTVFLTPELKPFFGGTYFPPDERYGRPGFPRVLEALSKAYRDDAGMVAENAARLTKAIGDLETITVQEHKRVDLNSLKNIAEKLYSELDLENGGFGRAPKFPNTMNLAFLWRIGQSLKISKYDDAVLLALSKMAEGGIYDQIGGGFSRYSVDAHWSVPHFEKMLYDNALLLKLYSEVLLCTKLSEEQLDIFSRTVEDTLIYLLREMQHPSGGFYAAQDADSEGVEGKFFIWTPEELRAILSDDDFEIFCARFGVTEHGNFEHTNATVLYVAQSFSELSKQFKKPEAEIRKIVTAAREKIFLARENRIKPLLDDKILASWNGLAVSGLCWAAKALKTSNPELTLKALHAAEKAMHFIASDMRADTENCRLFSVFHGEKNKPGRAKLNAYLDDYAFAAAGAIDLARTTADSKTNWIEQAMRWTQTIQKHFSDAANPGFFFTSNDHEALLQRPKTLYDQAIPSGTAVALSCMLILDELKPLEHTWKADEQFYKLFPLLEKSPFGMGELACAALLQLSGPITISGSNAQEFCTHPHLFADNSNAASTPTYCQNKSCFELPTNKEGARSTLLEKANSLSETASA